MCDSGRDWQVAHGFYCDRFAYSGSSTILAGLNWARLHRKPHRCDAGGCSRRVVDCASYDTNGDAQTDEEKYFFDQCAIIGKRFKDRRTWDSSKNWKPISTGEAAK